MPAIVNTGGIVALSTRGNWAAKQTARPAMAQTDHQPIRSAKDRPFTRALDLAGGVKTGSGSRILRIVAKIDRQRRPTAQD